MSMRINGKFSNSEVVNAAMVLDMAGVTSREYEEFTDSIIKVNKPGDLEVYGASDDLIEFDGATRDEASAYTPKRLDFSNGAALNIEYGNEGIWRITPLSGDISVTKCVEEKDEDKGYTDIAIVKGPIQWIRVSPWEGSNADSK